jgi:acyl-CoA dehydrogenase
MSVDPLESTVADILDEGWSWDAQQRAESEGWSSDCWELLAKAEMPWVGVSEARGGAGGTMADATKVVRQVGRYAAPVPVAETGLVGGGFAASLGIEVPRGIVSVAVPSRDDALRLDSSGNVTGVLHRVPWGRHASAVVAIADVESGHRVVLLDPAAGQIEERDNIAGEPRDRLTFDNIGVPSENIADCPDEIADDLMLRGAISRIALMAGASRAVARMAVKYTQERQQFGRAVGNFQAVSTRLAALVEESEAAYLASRILTSRLANETHGTELRNYEFEIAAAKAATSRSAAEVSKQGHQVHGAIGMTREYPLHRFNRRLWVWAHEYGSERYWNKHLGWTLLANGVDNLWPTVAAGRYTS